MDHSFMTYIHMAGSGCTWTCEGPSAKKISPVRDWRSTLCNWRLCWVQIHVTQKLGQISEIWPSYCKTVGHQSSTYTFMPNFIEIEENFVKRRCPTKGQIHGQTFETGFIGSTRWKSRPKMTPTTETVKTTPLLCHEEQWIQFTHWQK